MSSDVFRIVSYGLLDRFCNACLWRNKRRNVFRVQTNQVINYENLSIAVLSRGNTNRRNFKFIPKWARKVRWYGFDDAGKGSRCLMR